jgi:RNA polymerase sigma factor (sigma-70 family)
VSDGELIERFRARRDEIGERAFEALVARHGSMVMGVCRSVLEDPGDAHDAFQATFLVLARRAGSIRNRESVGSWLYGVAVRVARRGRVEVIRRQVGARRALEVVRAGAAVAVESAEGVVERDDRSVVVHQELARLSERDRAAVVLCYLEGLTHDEAAARLGWPVGTVRSRLARARERLRGRLERRGVTGAGLVVGGDRAGSGVGGRGGGGAVPVSVVKALTCAVVPFVDGPPLAAGLLSANAVGLAQGVLRGMMVMKLLGVGCAILVLGVSVEGGRVLLVRGAGVQEGKAATAAPAQKAENRQDVVNPSKENVHSSEDTLIRAIVEAARARLETQRAYYEEGRITVDRFIDASEQLELAELRGAGTALERAAIRKQHFDRLKAIEARESGELQVGRGTAADLKEATVRRMVAELELTTGAKEDAEKASLVRRGKESKAGDGAKAGAAGPGRVTVAGVVDPLVQEVVKAARDRYEMVRQLYLQGETTLDRVLPASELLEMAEMRGSGGVEERKAVRQRQMDRLKEIEEVAKVKFGNALGSYADVLESTTRRMVAEIELTAGAKEDAEKAELVRRVKELERRVEELERGRRVAPGGK